MPRIHCEPITITLMNLSKPSKQERAHCSAVLPEMKKSSGNKARIHMAREELKQKPPTNAITIDSEGQHSIIASSSASEEAAVMRAHTHTRSDRSFHILKQCNDDEPGMKIEIEGPLRCAARTRRNTDPPRPSRQQMMESLPEQQRRSYTDLPMAMRPPSSHQQQDPAPITPVVEPNKVPYKSSIRSGSKDSNGSSSKGNNSNLTNSSHSNNNKQERTTRPRRSTNSSTCLRHLDLGDPGSPSDYIHCIDPLLSTQLISSLKKHDFVFILRSDGSWTYSIIADVQTNKLIRFVVDTKGGNKTLSRRKWVESIRLVNNTVNREKIQGSHVLLPSLPEVYKTTTLGRHSSMPGNLRLEEIEEGDASEAPSKVRRQSVHSALSLFE